jgi:hypothetical protein
MAFGEVSVGIKQCTPDLLVFGKSTDDQQLQEQIDSDENKSDRTENGDQ